MIGHQTWIPVRDADARGRGLYRRHYSAYRYADGRRPAKFVGPGEHIVLLTPGSDALFVWRVFLEVNQSEPLGINCSVFRNESSYLASELILEAEPWAWERWPGLNRLYTLVDPRKVRSTNPGYCFIMAGWRKVGVRKKGQIEFEKWR